MSSRHLAMAVRAVSERCCVGGKRGKGGARRGAKQRKNSRQASSQPISDQRMEYGSKSGVRGMQHWMGRERGEGDIRGED